MARFPCEGCHAIPSIACERAARPRTPCPEDALIGSSRVDCSRAESTSAALHALARPPHPSVNYLILLDRKHRKSYLQSISPSPTLAVPLDRPGETLS